MAGFPVGVVGANGFLGGELVRLLELHPHLELAAAVAGSSAGKPLRDARPSLPVPVVLERFDADRLAETCRAVFLALPHGESAIAARALVDRGVKVIDLGSDLRLRDPAEHLRWYGREQGDPALAAESWYSLPELTGEIPASTRAIANPGCFATALNLATAPLVPHLAPGARLTVFGITGSSGSGIAPAAGVHHSTRTTSFVAYKSLEHQHLGEVNQLLASRGALPELVFVPHSAPLVRGILLTMAIPTADLAGDPFVILDGAYAEHPFVDVGRGEIPLGAVVGSNRCQLSVVQKGSTTLVFAAIDNLLKGGSGQAVQNLNRWLGLPETAGLPRLGMWP